MNIRNTVAAAHQEGLVIIVLDAGNRGREAATARLLRLLAQPKFTARDDEEIRKLFAVLTEAQVVAAIRTQDDGYEPLSMSRRRLYWHQEPNPIHHRDSQAARFAEYVLSRADHFVDKRES